MNELDLARAEIISIRADILTQNFGEPTESDMAAINSRVPRPLEREALFVVPTIPSRSVLDSFGTRMAESSLKNYAQDATLGAPVMNSHRTPKQTAIGTDPGQLPVGRTFFGELQPDPDLPGFQRVYDRSYVIRGYHPNGAAEPGTDDLIRAIEGGVITDVSIGFGLGERGWLRCGICNEDAVRSRSCTHLPGITYELQDGTKERGYAWIEDAHMREKSFVYKGSAPGTMILKGQRLYEDGRADTRVLREFEELTGVRMMQRFSGVEIPKKQEPPQQQTEAEMTPAEFLKQLGHGDRVESEGEVSWDRAAVLLEEVIKAREAAAVKDLQVRYDLIEVKLRELEPKAKDGETYRENLISDTLLWGVRADKDFPKEAMEKMFRNPNTDIATIRAMLEAYQSRAADEFPISRRQTDPDPSKKLDNQSNERFERLPVAVDSRAYKTGASVVVPRK